jgi:glucose-1-phosphate cytidylyltransferase
MPSPGDAPVKVMILCGGMGTRIREETTTVPKPMVEIGGRPILWHIMKTYSHHGFNEFVLCLGYKGDVIRRFFMEYDALNCDVTVDLGTREVTRHNPGYDELGWKVTLAETGPTSMTGGRVRRALRYVDGETFMLTYGDAVADVDIAELLGFHRAHGRLATVTAVHPPSRFGRLEIDPGEARALSFAEKPAGAEGWVSGGYFVFQREIADYLDGDDCILEGEPLARLAADDQLMVYSHPGYWQCLDTIRDAELLRAAWDSGEAPWVRWKVRP